MEALRVYEQRGYSSQFGAREGGDIKCFQCGTLSDPDTFEMHSMRRIEGVSDPADESLVAALVCPNCSAHGTLTVSYGPMASPEDNEALRRMKDAREALRAGEWHSELWSREGGGPPGGGAGPASPPR